MDGIVGVDRRALKTQALPISSIQIDIKMDGSGLAADASGVHGEEKSKKWCRGPESNWLRPPFQGGALPVSYPGTQTTFLV
jgi:hypothetical protein